MLRRLIRHPRTQAVFAWLLGGYLAVVSRTTRWTLLGEEHIEAILGRGTAPDVAAATAGPRSGVIVGFWHERLAIMPMGWSHFRPRLPLLSGVRVNVLVSQHRDGRLIGDVASRFSLAMVYGSTSRGGATGLIMLARLMAAGEHVVITPDGPRGPRRKAAAGIAHLAALTGQPVVPLGAAVSRARVLGSWDRMLLPLPFGRGAIVVGPPIRVPRDGAEAMLPAIEAGLTAACEEADRIVRGGAAPRSAMA